MLMNFRQGERGRKKNVRVLPRFMVWVTDRTEFRFTELGVGVLQPELFPSVFLIAKGSSDSSAGTETACNAGDPASIPGREDPLEKG